MADREEIKKVVLDFVIKEYCEDDEGLTYDSPLITGGVVDSFTMVTLKRFLEIRYKIAIPDAKATPKAFDTVNSIAELVMEFIS
jgi:acyl carrier protein